MLKNRSVDEKIKLRMMQKKHLLISLLTIYLTFLYEQSPISYKFTA